MRETQEKYELFEHYLKGELAGQEKNEFEKRLKSDPDFSREFKAHEQIFGIVTDKGLMDIKKNLTRIHHRKTRWNRIYRYGGGAIVISILTAAIFLFFDKGSDLNQENGGIDQNIKSYINNEKDTKEEPVKSIELKKEPEVRISEEPPKNENLVPVVKNIGKELGSIPPKEHKEENPGIKEIPIKFEEPAELKDQNFNKAEIPKTEKPEPVKEDLCKDVEIYAAVNIKESCNNKATGSITFDKQTLSGGKPPYNFSIDNGKNYYNRYQFESLAAGRYDLYIKDNNDCISKLGMYMVERIDCTYDHAFSPTLGEVWEVPNQNKSGRLYILSKNGNLVFERDIEGFEKFEWNGNDNSGQQLPMGIYSFVIKYKDASETMGNVTIIR